MSKRRHISLGCCEKAEQFHALFGLPRLALLCFALGAVSKTHGAQAIAILRGEHRSGSQLYVRSLLILKHGARTKASLSAWHRFGANRQPKVTYGFHWVWYSNLRKPCAFIAFGTATKGNHWASQRLA